MSAMMFYSNPTPLDKKKHANIKLQRQNNYDFAANSNSLPVAGFEFFEASRSFPIFFVKNSQEQYVPIAILSLRSKGHELGSNWEGAYVPAYVRRYPFVLSSDGVVLFDADAPHLQEQDGDELFKNDEGEPTETLENIVQFLKTVDQGFRLTEEFCKAAAEKELFSKFSGGIKLPQGTINLGELYIINEKSLHEKLDEKDVYEWFNKGWLAWAHAHLHSLGSMNEVLKRARNAAPAAQETSEETSA
ncbi:SapC family protein [Agaribacterium haliotis]|uniref:SapC family protein n=1 Tax=Agaribacterium haliotis TaxID=2013869 RepID=UPI001EFDF742|nr:SapC family protein [Agaribacterium haliotis]